MDGILQRVFKNLWPSLRAFWLWASQEHSNATYIVFEKQRLTFHDVLQRSVRAASVYRDVYNIKKGSDRTVQISANHLPHLSFLVVIIGDRVAICSRNYPEYLVAFWACRQLRSYNVFSHNFIVI